LKHLVWISGFGNKIIYIAQSCDVLWSFPESTPNNDKQVKTKIVASLLAAVASIMMTSCSGLQQGGQQCQSNSYGYSSKGATVQTEIQEQGCAPAQTAAFSLSGLFAPNINLSSSVGVGVDGGFQRPVIIGGNRPQGRQVYQQQQFGGGQRYERCAPTKQYSSGWRPSNNGGYQRCQPTKQYPQGYRPYCPPTRGYQRQTVGYHPKPQINCPPRPTKVSTWRME
jgi:hypothetical protein